MLLKFQPKGLWSGTFHHIGNRCLRLYAKEIGYTEDFGILDVEDSKDLIKACEKSLHARVPAERFPKPAVIQTIISYSVNARLDISAVVDKQYSYFSHFIEGIERIKELYDARKKQSNNMDYDDLLVKWLYLMEHVPTASRRFRDQFRYILVDEYQDTNVIQSEIIQRLAATHRNVLVVGDDAQAIYSFRGATIKNILNFPRVYEDAKIFKLETNYRSTPESLELANDSISKNREQFEKRLRAVNTPFEKPALVEPKDLYSQAAFVAQRILELRDEGVELDDMAALFRAHYQAAELEMELVKRGIPYVVRGGVRFFEQAHIKDVLSYLRIAVNPFDEVSWLRALALQPGIGMAYADRLFKEFIDSKRPVEFVAGSHFGKVLPDRAKAGLVKFKRIMKPLLDEEIRRSPEDAIATILANGYEDHVLANFENAKDRLDDLKELVNFAHGYRSIKSFLTDVTLRESFKGETLNGAPSHDECLVISTIHQAKGLEWKAAFVIGLCENQFPHPKSMEEPAELEEERRLFYVAVTRSKQRLYLVHPLTRYDHQMGTVIARRSLFLEELSGDLYNVWELEEPEEGHIEDGAEGDVERVIDLDDSED
jgi:DNA helicase-2/ATP-dependent DNA helicase PcrA